MKKIGKNSVKTINNMYSVNLPTFDIKFLIKLC